MWVEMSDINASSDPLCRDLMTQRGIYFVTSNKFGMSHVEAAEAALRGGVKVIQYREKDAGTDSMIHEALKIKELCRAHDATFILNDHLEVARVVNPNGVHVGLEDAPIQTARTMFPNKVIGASADTPEQAREAQRKGASYVGVTVFPSTTKSNAVALGMERFAEICRSTILPVYAIGGMKLEHIEKVRAAGGDGIAVISAILGSEDPVEAARVLVKEWSNK